MFLLHLIENSNGLSSRETVSADFMAACLFLSDHMDNMENPSEEMVHTLSFFIELL